MQALQRGRTRQRAFTLVEVLIVIGVVAVLAALLVPVFSQAREKARAITCLSNERQIGLALMLYLQDYDEKYPQEYRPTTDPAVEDFNFQLETVDFGSPFDKVLAYISNKDTSKSQLFHCPSDPDPYDSGLLDSAGNCRYNTPPSPPPGHLYSYVVNAYYLFGATLTDINQPSQSIYLSERNEYFCNVHYHPWSKETELPSSSKDPNNPAAIASHRHNEGSNYAYADGHAKWQHFEETRRPFEGHELYGEHQAF